MYLYHSISIIYKIITFKQSNEKIFCILYNFKFYLQFIEVFFYYRNNINFFSFLIISLQNGIYSSLPYLAGMISSCLGGIIADYMINRGLKIDTTRKIMAAVGKCKIISL